MPNTLQNRASNVLAQGFTGTNSRRSTQYVEGVFPTHISKAQGPYVWDMEGRRYIDFVGGLGVTVLGYHHPKVDEAVTRQIQTGLVTGSMPSHLEVEVGEILTSMFPAVEKVRFLKTGSEACSAAVRIARTFSNETYIQSTGYHGHHDLFVSQTPPALGVKDIHHIGPDKRKNQAAYILEPIELDDSSLRKMEVQNSMAKGGLIIFDEVITGFRVPKLSAAKMWNLDPDITVFGKAIANGFPLAVVGGKKYIMDCDEYFISSTFSSEAISLVAAKATIEELMSRNMDDLFFYAKRFQDRLNEIIAPLDINIPGYGTRGMFPVEHENGALFMQECCKAGILFGKAYFFHFGHLEENVEEYVLNVVSDVVSKVSRGGAKLEGKAPAPTFKR